MRFLLFLLAASSALAQNALYIDLSGEWRKSADDRPAYAQPDFDDSNWIAVSLPWTPRPPKGVYWVRRSVELPAWADRRQLAITLGAVSEVYEVYVNGIRIGGTEPTYDSAHIARPRTFALPSEAVGSGATLMIALHSFREVFSPFPWLPWDTGPYLLTYLSHAPAQAGRQFIDQRRLQYSFRLVSAALSFVFALFLIIAWLGDRQRFELLLFAIFLTGHATNWVYAMSVLSMDSTPWNRNGVPAFELLTASIGSVVLAEFVMAALGYRFRWLRAGAWLGWSVCPLTLAFEADSMNVFYFAQLWPMIIAVSVIGAHWRRLAQTNESLEKHIFNGVLLLVCLSKVDFFGARALGREEVLPRLLDVGPYRLEREIVMAVVLAAVVLALLVRRLATDRRDKQRLAGEFEAARASQQLLLAQSETPSDAFAIDAVYRPAQEVGGDFYRILEDVDGARVLIVGDVSGKGLKAAMLVALIVGALRNTRERRAHALLTELNHAVYGQTDGGFVTCCCARVSADGSVTLANAGQLAPYLAGREVEAAGGLPLGVLSDAAYDECAIFLREREQLVFLSDGVVEAANSKGELFGFDRTREISNKPATEIAEAARAWGQNDDITVVTVRRRA